MITTIMYDFLLVLIFRFFIFIFLFFLGNNKDEDYSPKTLNDKNHQASSKKFRQLMSLLTSIICNHITLQSTYEIQVLI